MKRVITFGTFDLLHEGHLRILERARAQGDYLIVGVSTDRLNAEKGKRSFFDQEHRKECVAALACVNEVFFEDSLERKDEYIREFAADVLVMGDDWKGKFDWVSCDVVYLPRTEGISSTEVKASIGERFRPLRVLFGDTYLKKHYDCALSLVNEMTAANMAPILTQAKALPPGVDCDCIVYFNLPVNPPSGVYAAIPRVLVDHGASNLKWFLANQKRFDFFDVIITAGPDHTRSLLTFFPGDSDTGGKVRSAGFIKSKQLLGPPLSTREEIGLLCNLDPQKPIILFVPTWYITNNRDIAVAIDQISEIDNHVALLHPETAHIDVSRLNVAVNENGILSELLKHADCVISELSSTIFEAAALNKPIVQILLREYSDNNATLFDFPYSAGTAELFCGGLPTRPAGIKSAVERALSGDGVVREGMRRMSKRILAGTNISDESAENIVDEIGRAHELALDGRVEKLRAIARSESTYAVAHENLAFARNQLVAHGAGNFKGSHASSSAEALQAAVAAVDFVELDFVRGSDGVILAHDGYESKYGLDKPFSDTSCQEFLSRKFEGELAPLSIEAALALIAAPGKVLVCDIKSNGKDYEYVAESIFSEARARGLTSRLVIQAYDVADFNAALRIGFTKVFLAVWKKFYRDPLGEAALAFIDACMDIEASAVVGITIPYINKHMDRPAIDDPRMLQFQASWRRIYIHGAPISEYGRVLNGNFGLFVDSLSQLYELKDAPAGFRWREYLFLNPDVADAGHANPVGAMLHYLNYGRKEGRLTQYDCPVGFSQSLYVDMNPDLRKAGISGNDTAKAHWTKYGAKERRRYAR